MKTIIFATAAAVMMAVPASAWQGRTVACFDKVYVGPTYSTHKELVKAPKQQYEHVNGRIELVQYDAVYREYRTKASDGYWVMREVPCS